MERLLGPHFEGFGCRSNFGAIRLKLKMPEQVNSVRNFSEGCVPFESQFLNMRKKVALSLPENLYHNGEDAGFSISNIYLKC